MTDRPDWKTVASEKKSRQLAAIPKEWLDRLTANLPPQTELDVTLYPKVCGLLDGRELDITESDVPILLQRLSSGEWTAVEVTTAFCKRAVVAQQLTNCLTEIFFDRALARAAALDDYLKTTGKVVGMLHGLPISLKDQVNIKGLDSTIGERLFLYIQDTTDSYFPFSPGYVSYANKPAERNAVLADILESHGAVLFVKTNIPQTLMWPETHNNIFGRTLNPNNRSLTSGGSSGGEGALVALKGSPLGVGSDIGGSVRIPSACCGPLSNSLDGLKLFMQAVIDAKPWMKDPLAVCKRWNEEEYRLADYGDGKQLCFAVLWDDGVVAPHPPILRVIDWVPLKHAEIYKCISAIWSAGAAEDYEIVTAVSGEPVIQTMLPETDILAGETLSYRPSSATAFSAYKLWQVQKARRVLREEYLQHWQETIEVTGTGRPVDAIICPVAATPAPPHGTTKNANYTMIWNALDYAALVIPVSKVDQKLDVKRERSAFYNDDDKAHYESYDPATYVNAPIAVQIVGRTLQEEAVLGMAEIVDFALKAHNPKL
ncbi:hypothetical protein AAF712_000654 [Marasmius tenuissimus]|uniref:amidase n=1 Tax=Marasmius tenuissimus TaxID=585030 RepID=A0ABR3ACR2_9AGAR